MNNIKIILLFLVLVSCKEVKKETVSVDNKPDAPQVTYAKGFSIEKLSSGITIIRVSSPWPNADEGLTYALVPRDKQATITLNADAYDAIVTVPVQRLVATSTTHIPALESLGAIDRLVGFPDTKYISSTAARKRIDKGAIKELGNNESLNTEMTIALNPDVVIGFGISSKNSIYETLQNSNIPVVYNGDWTEETPLGKAEWVKFFAPFFQMEQKADSIFGEIERSYLEAVSMAKNAKTKPTMVSGALYEDIWYLPGGNSWAAKFMEDANCDYLWKDTEETGSLSLSLESVLSTAQHAEYWISPSQHTSYSSMEENNAHYTQFDAFKDKKIYSFANTVGETGGLLYYELGPNRPDLILKDLIHIAHPDVLPNHELFFFKPLE